MNPIVSTDPEGAVIRWVRATGIGTLGQRAWYEVPDGNPTMPLLTVARLGGGPQSGGLLEDVLLVMDVWSKSKLEASDNARALTDALWNAGGTALDAGTWCHGTISVQSVWLPDRATKLARYSLTVQMTVEAIELP